MWRCTARRRRSAGAVRGEAAANGLEDSGGNYKSSVWHASYAHFVADGILYTGSFGDGGIPEDNEAGAALLYEVLDAFA